MRQTIIFILAIIGIMVLTDASVGLIMDNYVKNNKLPGDYASIDYLLKDADEDVIILGSSVALNSINPTIITDSTGLSCYNGGANAQEMPFMETMISCILERHKPQMFILGFRPDETCGSGLGDRFNILTPYYRLGYEKIDEKLESRGDTEGVLLNSSLYRYNTIWFRLMLYHFVTVGEQGRLGFVAKGIPPYPPQLDNCVTDNVSTTQRLEEFERVIKMCSDAGVELLVVFPPQYRKLYDGGNVSAINDIKRMCDVNGIVVLDDTMNERYLTAPQLFYDNTHLNKIGADEYSKVLATYLKKNNISNKLCE